jgi:SAM-dependent methyltransferase
MVMAVLQDKGQIEKARQELVRRHLSALDSPIRTLLRRVRLDGSPAIGDQVKSWDVLQTVEFIEKHVPKQGSVLDIGAYASEILIALHRLGFSNLAGVDLNPRLRQMRHADVIRYEISDFLQTPFADGSFDAITSISVIEHGFQGDRLLRETSRLLRPGGHFIASFDYWPEKIDTSGTNFFDMDWIIFSRADMSLFIEDAKRYGMAPAGPLAMDAMQKTIDCGGKQYTFGWLALRKVA